MPRAALRAASNLKQVNGPAQPLTVSQLRKQLPDMAPEDRSYMQQLLADETALKKALGDSQKMEASEVPLKSLVESLCMSAESPADLDSSFWKCVGLLIYQTKGRASLEDRIENVQLFVRLFEVAKMLEEPMRSDLLYRIGSYVYNLKMLRFDPVNEAEYLDALVQKQRPFDALKIWRSRLHRENNVYWWDIGILYHLEAGLAFGADALARQMLDQFNYVSPRAMCELIKVHKDIDTQKFWLDQLLSQGTEFPETEFVNQRYGVSAQQLKSLFFTFLMQRNWTLATVLVPVVDLQEWPAYTKPRAKSSPQGSLNDFAAAVVEKHPQSLENNLFLTIWISNLLHEDAQEAMEVIQGTGFKPTDTQAAQLVPLLAKVDPQLAKRFATEPLAAGAYLDYLAATNPSKIPQFVDDLNCDLTPYLAERILRHGGHIEYPLLDLCFDHACWKQLWALVRDKAVIEPRAAFQRMVEAGNFEPSLNLFEAILHSFILGQDPEGAVAVLMYMDEKFNLKPNKLLISSVNIGPESKFGKMARTDLPWPTAGPLAQHVPIQMFARKLGVELNVAQAICANWIST